CRMDPLRQTLYEVIQVYAKNPINGKSFMMMDESRSNISISTVATWEGKRSPSLDLMVHVEGDHIIIEHDANDKPLYEALVQAGIPREQIVLAYAGEALPEAQGK